MAEIIEITDFAAKELDVYARLSEVQLLRFREPQRGIFIAESPKVIERALRAGYEPISVLAEPGQLLGEAKEVLDRCVGVPVYTAPLAVLERLTGYKMARGLLCAMNRKELASVESLCEEAKRVAVLEHVVNPTNVGAIFRSAAALGIDAVLLSADCADPLYRRAARVSMGTVFQVPWTFFGENVSGTDVIRELGRVGFASAALALSDRSVAIDDPQLRREERLAIVLGNEGDGLCEETIAVCDYTVKIPMTHGVDSLNVAAASAVAFWELRARTF